MSAELLIYTQWVRWWFVPLVTFAPAVPLLAGVFTQRYRLFAWMFAVSMVADVLVLQGAPQRMVSATYPVLQLGLLVIALASGWMVGFLAYGIGAVAAVAVMLGGWAHPSAILPVFGALLVMMFLPQIPRRLRAVLLVYFVVGGLSRLWYVASPGLWPYLAYQACRLVGLGGVTFRMVRDA